ncbi:MAG: agmatinase family protein, partial [Planctomycetota bacterium]
MNSFDPNAAAAPESGAFGLDTPADEARVHLFGVPVEATTSYRRGTRHAPAAIHAASKQVDLEDLLTGRPWEAGIHWHDVDERLLAIETKASALALPVIAAGGAAAGPQFARAAAQVDELLDEMNAIVYARASASIRAGHLVGLVGGDHSTPFGSIRAHAEAYPGLGLLQFDAHLDLRAGYEGFRNSHASIVHNVAEATDARVVALGIRDVGGDELDALERSNGRFQAVFASDWARARSNGRLAARIAETVELLPEQVYITFDIDGLDPSLCPNTGTPVPGGLLWDETMDVLEALVASGRRIVGFDLVEVSPEPGRLAGTGWDEIVGARLLYRLLGFALQANAA